MYPPHIQTTLPQYGNGYRPVPERHAFSAPPTYTGPGFGPFGVPDTYANHPNGSAISEYATPTPMYPFPGEVSP